MKAIDPILLDGFRATYKRQPGMVLLPLSNGRRLAAGLHGALLILLLSTPAIAAPGCDAPAPTEITLLQWNVENLFDADDDPANPGDDEFTPQSWRRWTGALYREKTRHLASVIARVKPDIVTLEEVENRRVLEDLASDVLKLGGPDFRHIVHREGSDHRGIDIAALSTIKPQSVHWVTPVEGQRDILRIDIAPAERPLTIFVNHWKSRWGGVEATAPMRARQARSLRQEINRIQSSAHHAAIVVAGDLNEDAGGPAQSIHAGISIHLDAVRADPTRLLLNMAATLPVEARGTYYYRKDNQWNSFDIMAVSSTMLPSGKGPWRIAGTGYRVVREPCLLDAEGHPVPFRKVYNRQTKQWPYVKGYSDHLPVILTINVR